MRLVDLVDRVLDVMDEDQRFVFTLDGQLATVDDYLELRPENEERIRRLVESGRLAIGPWQTLMDEFLVSGETIVRNLEAGLARARELGGEMRVGYLPDMFGHAAQMPQLLRRAGIEHAVVWRGVPWAIDSHAFRWEAPDGSAVRAEYLVYGYGGAAHLLDVPGRLAEKVELLDETLRPFFGDEPVLAMYGTDHMEPAPDLAGLVADLNGAQGRFEVRLSTLADYIAQAPAPDGSPSWTGELRSGARANMLMGVTSARVDLKAACARAERVLERYAEPLDALWGPGGDERSLALAWHRVLENSAHDSICGCSADAVGAQVLVRYAEAEQIGGELLRRTLDAVARSTPRGWFSVVNPSPSARRDAIELDAAVPEVWADVALELPDGTRVATQELERTTPLLLTQRLQGADVAPRLFNRIHGRELFGRWWNALELDLDARRATLVLGEEQDPPFVDIDELKRELVAATDGARDEEWEVTLVARPRRRIVASVPAPPLGRTAVRPVEGGGPLENAVGRRGETLTNGLLSVAAGPDGTFTVERAGVTITGAGRLVDGGDAGDTYNYAPPETDTPVEGPLEVATRVREDGPVRGQIVSRRAFEWPLRVANGRRSSETASVTVTTLAELRAGEPFVRFRVELVNPSRDHRLRFHVPLPEPASTSFAEGQFCVVERGLEPEGGYGEVPLPTFPAHGFVSAGRVAVLLDHVLEYELVERSELALTLLRSVGLVSRNVHAFRDDPAGPELAVPDAQLLGPLSVSFAVLPHDGDWTEAIGAAERFRHPFVTAPGGGAADLRAAAEAGLELDGDGVVLTALRRRGERIEARLACESSVERRVTLRGAIAGAWETNLVGEEGRELRVSNGALTTTLAPWEIRTVQIAVQTA